MTYQECNLNPTGKKVGDCVVRAIQKATKQTWLEVYNDLCQLGATKYRMPNDKEVYEEYLLAKGFVKHKMPKDQNGNRYPIHKLADELPNKTIVISISKHLTVVANGVLYDSWDCARKSVYNYYTK